MKRHQKCWYSPFRDVFLALQCSFGFPTFFSSNKWTVGLSTQKCCTTVHTSTARISKWLPKLEYSIEKLLYVVVNFSNNLITYLKIFESICTRSKGSSFRPWDWHGSLCYEPQTSKQIQCLLKQKFELFGDGQFVWSFIWFGNLTYPCGKDYQV